MYFVLVGPPYTRFPVPGRGGRTLIGRAVTCEIFLPQPGVAKHHAVLHQREGYWHMCESLDRSARTLLNGAVPNVPFQIIDGDLLTIGEVVLKFVSEM